MKIRSLTPLILLPLLILGCGGQEKETPTERTVSVLTEKAPQRKSTLSEVAKYIEPVRTEWDGADPYKLSKKMKIAFDRTGKFSHQLNLSYFEPNVARLAPELSTAFLDDPYCFARIDLKRNLRGRLYSRDFVTNMETLFLGESKQRRVAVKFLELEGKVPDGTIAVVSFKGGKEKFLASAPIRGPFSE